MRIKFTLPLERILPELAGALQLLGGRRADGNSPLHHSWFFNFTSCEVPIIIKCVFELIRYSH